MEEKVKVVNLISSRVNIDLPDVRLKRIWERKGNPPYPRPHLCLS